MRMYGFHVILKNSFATEDFDTVIDQLVFRSQGDLEQLVTIEIYLFVWSEK